MSLPATRIFYFTFNHLFFSIWIFLSQKLTNHRTAEEGGGYFFNSSIPLPPGSQTESSPLHIASSRT